MPARLVSFWKLSGSSARRAVSVSVFAVVVMPLVSDPRLSWIVRSCASASAGVRRREREQKGVLARGDRRVVVADHRLVRVERAAAASYSLRRAAARRAVVIGRQRALERDPVALFGSDGREEVVERRGLHQRVARELAQQERDGRDVGLPVGRHREHDAARLRRRLVGDLGEPGEHPLDPQRGRTVAPDEPLEAAVGCDRRRGCAVGGRQRERLRRREWFVDRRERGVRTTNRPMSSCVSRLTVASSTGSTNAVRGSGISPVAASIAFEPATYSAGTCAPRPSASIVGPSIGT